MRLANLISKLEKRIPCAWAEEWDNPGLSVGNPDCDVEKIALALDVTEDTVHQSAVTGCQLLVTHHPIIFHAMKNLIFHTPGPRAIGMAIENRISLYSAHTNWDSSREGVNFCLAEALGLNDIEPLISPQADNGAWGMGAVGNIPDAVRLEDFMRLAKERWRLSSCSGFGDAAGPISRVAIGGGSCSDFWPQALAVGADVFITADVPYHNRNDSLAMGLSLIVIDHGEMERVSLTALKSLLEDETGLETVILREDPVRRLTV